MKDQFKTKQKLIQELSSLRQKVSETERLESVFRKAEMRLSAVNECLLSLSNDVGDNIRRLTVLAGELMGATASIYNRLEGDMLVAVGQWQTPTDFKTKDRAQGHICYDVIRKNEESIVHIRNLAETPYAETDPNVCAYGLATYIGHVVRWGSEPIGSLCVVFQRDFIPTADDERLLGILSSSLGAEEKRRLNENALQESEERFRLLIETTGDIIYTVDRKGFLTYVNPMFERILGYTHHELQGKSFAQIVAPECIDLVKDHFRRAMKGEAIPVYEADLIRKDGARLPVEFNVVTIYDSEGKPFGRYGIGRDVTDRKRAEDALRESEGRYKRLLESVTDYIYTVQVEDGRPVTTVHGPGCAAVSGYTTEDYQADPYLWYRMVYAQDRDIVTEHAARVIAGETTAALEHRIVHRDGSARWVRNTPVPRYDEHIRLVSYDGSISNITDRKRAEEALGESEKKYLELSITDNLTNLYNSRYFYNQLKMEIDRVNRYGQPLTLLLFDIDGFKAFNDNYGHIEGDEVLWRLGQVVKRCLRQTDSAYRYGGEEFTILLPMTTSEDGAVIAERIRAELKKETFSPVSGKHVYITVSIGLAQYKPQEDMKAFVHRVDQLMYQAKKNGKDKVCPES